MCWCIVDYIKILIDILTFFGWITFLYFCSVGKSCSCFLYWYTNLIFKFLWLLNGFIWCNFLDNNFILQVVKCVYPDSGWYTIFLIKVSYEQVYKCLYRFFVEFENLSVYPPLYTLSLSLFLTHKHPHYVLCTISQLTVKISCCKLLNL